MKKKRLSTSVILLFGLMSIHAQESVVTSGGEATGTGGSSSYSIGQVAYTTQEGSNGSVAQGVQQPYEISTTVGIEVANINIGLSVYPNPTANYLTLNLEDIEFSNLSFQLYDMQGKEIENRGLTSNSTTINMELLPVSTYFLKVTNNQKIIKTFKIIKN